MVVKKFEEFVNEGFCCKSWNENELSNYLSEFEHEFDPGMWTDDDGSFELGDEPDFTENDLDFERFCIDYELDKRDFVGIYSYYNVVTCEPESEDDFILIYYDREKHKFDSIQIDFKNDIEEYLKKYKKEF